MKKIQQAKTAGANNVIVQAIGDGINVTVGSAHLTLFPPRSSAREIRTEIDLLNAYCRSITLIGREADMQSLWDWLYSPRPVAVRTLKGRAGAGKTRIAIELIERLNAEKSGQWWAGFVGRREMHRFAVQQNLGDWGWARPTLVVVDYAASLIEPLREWLRDLAQNPTRNGGHPLRLLFLEREASAGEGWLQSLCSGGQSEAGVPDLFDPLEPKLLDPLDTLDKRRAVLGTMLIEAAKLAKCSSPKLPAPGQNARFDQQLKNEEWADPLYLMMAALLSLHFDLVEVLQLPRIELAMQLVDHEIKRLIEGVPHEVERLPVHLAALTALGGGLTHELALKVADEECAALKLNYPGGAGALVAHLHEVLPAPDHGIAPIIPDILAEALVLKAMKKCPVAQQEEVMLRAVKNLGRRVIPFIVRTVQDFAPTGVVAPMNWLERLIMAAQADDVGLLVEIESAMPHQTLVLREKAVEVDELLAERWGKLVAENPSEAILAKQSQLLNNLSVRLSALGRREEALANAQESVRIYEQLAQARPDAFLRDLAGSLDNLANRLSDLGRREQALAKAQESVRIHEQLAQSRPDTFLPNLAASLNNLASILSDLGRREEALAKAQESVRIHEQLAQARPDAFLRDLAGSLTNLANRLSALGQREEALAKAQESVRIYEQLAQARPDAFLPNLAASLNNLANTLSNLGRREEALTKAQEAVRIREQLAQARPDAFLPDLAGSLNNLANMLGDLGRREEALAKAQESVQIYEQLAQARPDAFLPDLAGSLNNLANMLSALGRREEALAKAQESVRIREQLAQARPDAFLPDLAGSLNNLSARLNALGRREEALAKAQESVRIYEQLAQARPDAFLRDLAMSLDNLANMLSALGRREEALAKAQESVRIYEQLAQARPDAFLPDLAGSLNNLAVLLRTLGQREEALAKAQESVRIHEQLAQSRPDTFLPNLAASLNNLANMLSDLGRQEKALAKAQESVRIYEQLAQARPDTFLPNLAGARGARGAILRGMENHIEAAASFAQGIQTLTPIFQRMPSAFAQVIADLCQDYVLTCEHAKAAPDMALLAPVLEVFEKLKQQ